MSIRKFLSSCAKFITGEEGSVLPFVAMTFPVVVGVSGMGVDASLWMAHKRSMQDAADAAVIAAGWEFAKESPEFMDAQALEVAINNGFLPERGGDVEVAIIDQVDDDTATIAVRVSQDAESFFSKIVFKSPITVSGYAEATVDGVTGEFCVLALDKVVPSAIDASGAVDINSPNCGLAVNSEDAQALTISGNSSVNVGKVRVAGGYEASGSYDFQYTALNTGVSPLPDPYEDLEIPAYTPCGSGGGTHVNSTTTLTPGVFCGGLTISGNNDITFEPGVYIIDGGDFKVTGNGSLFGDGVSFILTGSGNQYAEANISGGRLIEFSAPAAGQPMSGIAFYQDRNAPSSNNANNKITGTADLEISGVMYFPSQGLWFGGNNTLQGGADPCTLLIAKTVEFNGNPQFGNDCDGMDVEGMGLPSVKLTL